MAQFTECQRQAFELVCEGHNVCVLGQGGTGKTFLIKELYKHLSKEQTVQITCSTGKACTLYERQGATTLHSWAGLKDGRFTIRELLERIDDETFEPVKKHIKATDVLIIDEISMISARIFDQLEHVCRHVRQNDRIFGGIQLIVAGDFYQLPPVSNELYGDPGKHCFLHPNWKKAVPHHVTLDEVVRQNELDLIQAINDLEKGDPSPQTSELMHSLSRPLDPEITPTYIYARNFDVDMKNHDLLEQMPGERKVFNAKDKGDKHYFKYFQAPEKLALKVGCPVMLICNLGGKLLNGVTGVVTNIDDDEVTCRFGNMTHKIHRETFTVYDPVTRTIVAERLQFPLKLCFAITIHKVQGMTLDAAIVDCKGVFLPGQVGVAVGRVKCKAGLQVLNYHNKLVRKHPFHVEAFYAEKSAPVSANCCQGIEFDGHITEDLLCDFQGTPCSSDDDSSVSDADVLDSHNIDGILEVTEPADQTSNAIKFSQDLLQQLLEEYQGCPNEKYAIDLYDSVTLLPHTYYSWIQHQREIIEKCINTRLQIEKHVSLKHLTSFGTDINVYLQTDEYHNSCKALLESYIHGVADEHFEVLTSVMFLLENTLLKELCTKSVPQDKGIQPDVLPAVCYDQHNMLESPPDDTVDSCQIAGGIRVSKMTQGGCGKIRHIGGFCIAKLKWKRKKMLSTYMFNDAKKQEFKQLRSEIEILGMMEASYDDIQEKETLQETFRKQNIRESLTYISDEVQAFFVQLEAACRERMSNEKLNKYGTYLFNVVQEEIKANEALRNQWQHLFKGKLGENANETTLFLYTDVVKKFIKVYASQFRKTYLLTVKREKGMAHRKKVMAKKEQSSKSESVSVEEIIENSSVSKREVTQLRLKAMCLTDKQCFNTRAYTKTKLISICKIYGVKASMKDTKKVLSEKLSDAILQCTCTQPPSVSTADEHAVDNQMPSTSGMFENHDQIDENTVSEGNSAGSRKRKCSSSRKGKGKKKKSKDMPACEQKTSPCCSVCHNELGDSSDLIACDLCDVWLHRHCAAIYDDEDWKRYQNGIYDFFCPRCKQ